MSHTRSYSSMVPSEVAVRSRRELALALWAVHWRPPRICIGNRTRADKTSIPKSWVTAFCIVWWGWWWSHVVCLVIRGTQHRLWQFIFMALSYIHFPFPFHYAQQYPKSLPCLGSDRCLGWGLSWLLPLSWVFLITPRFVVEILPSFGQLRPMGGTFAFLGLDRLGVQCSATCGG